MKIKTLDTSNSSFSNDLSEYLSLRVKNSAYVEKSVDQILNDVRKNGDKALIQFSRKYDDTSYKKISDSLVSKKEIKEAYSVVPKKTLANIKKAITNIKK